MDNVFLPDNILIKKLKSKNRDTIEEGFEGIYYKYAKLAFTCINEIVKNYNDSEDLVSETFLNIFNKRESLLEEKNIKYYIVVSAKNMALNFVNKKKLDIISDDNYIYEDVSDHSSNLNEMIELLKENLDNDEVDIIISHIIFADTFEIIGKRMNLNTNTVKTKYYRAIEKVKQ